MRIVIRAGGVGTRLWPMSRQANPKQFQKVSGELSMIRTTFERIKPLILDKNNVFISVNYKMLKRVQEEIPEVFSKNLIVETDTRNTGPAICLEVCYLEKICDQNEIIASLTSDDYISSAEEFRKLLQISEQFLNKSSNYVLALSVSPTHIDTGYTYFKIGEKIKNSSEYPMYKVAKVVEKPNRELCAKLFESGEYYCHTGMYMWRLGYIASLFQKLQPQMYKTCQQIVEMMLKGADSKIINNLYQSLEKISIESAITNKTNNLAMSVSNYFGWSDLGKWHIIKRILSQQGENLIKGEVFTHEANNNLAYNNNKNKLIVLNDVDDLIVVDTSDVLLISSSKNSDQVKKIVDKLKQQNKTQYL